MADVETIKGASRNLRGTLRDELHGADPSFAEDSKHLLKFHGTYQGLDREVRAKGAPPLPPEEKHQFMIRVRLPGGSFTPDQYLALDALAGSCANGTLRATSRQAFQFHQVKKRRLGQLMRGVIDAGLSTWNACGDVNRNVMATALPLAAPAYRQIHELAQALQQRLQADPAAYLETWHDAPAAPPKPDPIYGDLYLPRKFKIGVAIPPDNDIDVLAYDLGFIAEVVDGQLAGYTVTAGGGMGMDPNKPGTRPFLAQPIGWCARDEAPAVALAVLTAFRDLGRRDDRKFARLKYVVDRLGAAGFRAEVEARLGRRLADPKPFRFTSVADRLGWHAQGDGRFFYGLCVPEGRIADHGPVRWRSGLKALVERLRCPMRLTGNTNLYLHDLAAGDRAVADAILAAHGLTGHLAGSQARRMGQACVALPTCALARTESERVFPAVMDQFEAVFRDLGLMDEHILVRMTGCPNGCARPYNADFGLVGKIAGRYVMYVGGSHRGDRLATAYDPDVPLAEIGARVRPILAAYAAGRSAGERFTDWWGRTHPEAGKWKGG